MLDGGLRLALLEVDKRKVDMNLRRGGVQLGRGTNEDKRGPPVTERSEDAAKIVVGLEGGGIERKRPPKALHSTFQIPSALHRDAEIDLPVGRGRRGRWLGAVLLDCHHLGSSRSLARLGSLQAITRASHGRIGAFADISPLPR